jgi:hypothetical protein
LSLGFLPAIGGHFLRAACRRDKCARSLGARDDENLSGGTSWLTFLLLSSAPRRGKECGTEQRVQIFLAARQLFQNPNSVRCSAQSAGSREALRIKLLALSWCGWRPLTIAVVM